jgi:hypothetical protein
VNGGESNKETRAFATIFEPYTIYIQIKYNKKGIIHKVF